MKKDHDGEVHVSEGRDGGWGYPNHKAYILLGFIKPRTLIWVRQEINIIPLASLEMLWTTGLKMLGEDTERRGNSNVA